LSQTRKQQILTAKACFLHQLSHLTGTVLGPAKIVVALYVIQTKQCGSNLFSWCQLTGK